MEAVTPERVTELLRRADTLRFALGVNQDDPRGAWWEFLIRTACKPIDSFGSGVDSQGGASGVDQALTRQSRHVEFSHQRTACLRALDLLLCRIEQLGPDHRFTAEERAVVYKMLIEFARRRNAYETQMTLVEAMPAAGGSEEGARSGEDAASAPAIADAAPQGGPAESASGPETAEKMLEKSDLLRVSLDLPPEISKGWKQLLAEASKELSDPECALDAMGDRLRYLTMRHTDLTKKRSACFTAIGLCVQVCEKAPHHRFDDMERSVLLEMITEYVQGRLEYERIWRREEKRSMMPAYLAVFVEEFAEEGVEGIMPLSKEWTSKTMQVLDRQTQRHLLNASLRVRNRLAASGMKHFPTLSKVFMGNGKAAGFFGEILKKAGEGMRPDSYFTLVLYAYYVHTAPDKAAAAMQFASFLALSGLSNAALAASEAFLKGAGYLRTAAIPGNLVVKIAFAICIALGFEKAFGFENMTTSAKRSVDPALWDAYGTVADWLGGGLVVEQVGAIGYMTGLRQADPDTQQMGFLSQKALVRRGPDDYARVFVNTLLDWDEHVRYRMRREPNPVLRRSWEAQLVNGGPGGREGWISRQALAFYQGVARLRGTQEEMGELIKKFGILDTPAFAYFDAAVIEEGNLHGDIGIDALMQRGFHKKVDDAIKRLKREKKDDPDVKMLGTLWSRCQQMASALAERRSVYVHLGVYDDSWVKDRSSRTPEGREDRYVPRIIEEGMIGSMLQQSWRADALRTESHPDITPEEYGQKLAQVLQVERKQSDMPSILGQPVAWAKWCARYPWQEQKRLRKRQDKFLLSHLGREIAGAVPDDVRQRVFEPIQDMIAEQGDENLADPERAAQVLLQAYARLSHDGELRKGLTDSEKSVESGRGPGSAGLKRAGNLSVLGSVDPGGFMLKVPSGDPTSAPHVSDRYTDRFPNLDVPRVYAPMIASTQTLGQSRIDTLTDFEYDAEKEEWTVRVSVAAAVRHRSPHREGWQGIQSDREFVFDPSLVYSQTLSEWMNEHPQSALHLTPDFRRFEEAKRLEKQQWQRYRASLELARREGTIREVKDEERERAKETAKERPDVWHRYPVSEGEGPDRACSYVAYLSSVGKLVFLRIPRKENAARTGIMLEDGTLRVLNPDFPLEEHAISHLIREALVLPVADNSWQSIQKILGVYVESHDLDVTNPMTKEIVRMYEEMTTDAQRYRFLGFLQRTIHDVTRGQERKGPLRLVKYATKGMGRYLTQELYEEHVREKLEKFMGTIQST